MNALAFGAVCFIVVEKAAKDRLVPNSSYDKEYDEDAAEACNRTRPVQSCASTKQYQYAQCL